MRERQFRYQLQISDFSSLARDTRESVCKRVNFKVQHLSFNFGTEVAIAQERGVAIASRRGGARALSSRDLANRWELWDEIEHAKSARARAANATNAHAAR